MQSGLDSRTRLLKISVHEHQHVQQEQGIDVVEGEEVREKHSSAQNDGRKVVMAQTLRD